MAERRPLLRDVATRAGVSLKTASRVLNGEPHVSPGTAGRVRDAITELGYVPDPVARQLRAGGAAAAGAGEGCAGRSVTPRGFAVYDELADHNGSTVRVQKSSLATGDCAWIFASHPAGRLRTDIRERLERAGFTTQVHLDELAAFLTPSPHLDVEQAIRVRDALGAFIGEHGGERRDGEAAS